VSFLVGICGGTGSGKTTLARRVVEQLQATNGPRAASSLHFDAYYRDQSHLPPDQRAEVNYDHPDSLDGPLLVEHLRALQAGQEVTVPVYDFSTHTRSPDLQIVEPADVIVVEGILLFAFEPVWDQLDYRVFRHCPEAVRFRRRTERDQVERGRSLASITAQLQATVKPMHDRFVEPHAERADFVTRHGDSLRTITEQVVATISGLAAATR
jgi:uridine kinase